MYLHNKTKLISPYTKVQQYKMHCIKIFSQSFVLKLIILYITWFKWNSAAAAADLPFELIFSDYSLNDDVY